MSPLDEYADEELAALYDLQYAGWTDDLPLYESFAQRGELPSLELMVGTGRVALHLARNGHRVVGIDNSLSMLARLEAQLDRETAQRIRLVEADVRDFDLGGEKFDLIYCALCSLELLHAPADQAATLRCVAKHLAPGGVFVAELRSSPPSTGARSRPRSVTNGRAPTRPPASVSRSSTPLPRPAPARRRSIR